MAHEPDPLNVVEEQDATVISLEGRWQCGITDVASGMVSPAQGAVSGLAVLKSTHPGSEHSPQARRTGPFLHCVGSTASTHSRPPTSRTPTSGRGPGRSGPDGSTNLVHGARVEMVQGQRERRSRAVATREALVNAAKTIAAMTHALVEGTTQ